LGKGLLGLALVVGIVAWRLAQVGELPLPAWVDSVHHALIVRLIEEQGGLPRDFLPFFPAEFHYHFGFHAAAAVFGWWSGLEAGEAVLWLGQALNAAVSLSVYRLGYTLAGGDEGAQQELGGGRRGFAVGLGAALLSGFMFQMPGYYATWGRYTLLAGLALLGPALAAVWELWREPGQWGAGVRLALLTAGMGLCHIFVVGLAGLFLALVGLAGGWRDRSKWKALAGWAGLGVGLALPWLLPAAVNFPMELGARLVLPAGENQGALESLRYTIFLLGPRHNHILLGMAGMGLVFALRDRGLRPLAAWGLALGLLALPWGVRLDPFRPDYFTIVLFFPAAILLAALVVDGAAAVGRLAGGRGWVEAGALALALGLFLAWGLRETRRVINSATVLATHADVAALEWVRENTPAEARFFINSARWIGEVYRGVDGGYWLAPYTGRASLVPPALYSLAGREVIDQVEGWAERSAKLEGCGADFWALAREAGLTHVYLREGVGALQPVELAGCPRLRKVYEQEGVVIYEILRP
jgi:hypothetical protein